MNVTTETRARLVGVNHVVLEVGNLEAALDFYAEIFDFDLRGQSDTKAFIDMGDQFLVLAEVDDTGDTVDAAHHVGVVVDDPDAVGQRVTDLKVPRVSTTGVDFRDPWGNWIQIVDYAEIQFTKADHVLAGMNLDDLKKSDDAIEELERKGMAPSAE